MREIKFRAWDWNKMIYNVFPTPNRREVRDYNLGEETLEKVHENIMQFTGLKDKNGKDIYEGDIVNTTVRGICDIIWNEKENAFRLSKYNELPLSILNLEVIGNVFENPELINHPLT